MAAATVEVILDASQAKQGIDSLNKGFAKVDLSIRRLEKTMLRIEASINKIVNPIRALAKSLVALNNLTGGYAKQIDFITNANKSLSDQLKKSQDDLRKTAENLSRKAKAAAVATKQLQKLEKASEKAGTRLIVFERNLGAINYALKRLSFNLKTGEYMFSVITQAIASFIAQNVVGYLIRMTDQFKLMESRLRIVNSNFATLNTNLRSTVSVALATRQSLFAIGNLMARIGRNSQELKTDTLQLAKATSTISKAFQIAGATAEEARNAIVQLSQALASGRLQGDELRSILELAPTLAESISKSIGITVGQLREFAREGLITTEIMLSAVAKSTKEIDDNFKNIRPTISQSITNVQTAMQAVLGFNNSFKKANDALARTFLNLALYIQKFAEDSEKINVVADFVRKFSENLIPLAAAVITAAKNLAIYVAAVYAADKALKILAATSQVYATAMAIANAVTAANPFVGMAKAVGELIKVFVQLGALAYGMKEVAQSFEDTKNSVGLLADNTRTFAETMEYAQKQIDKTNEEAAKFQKKSLTEMEELTIKWQEYTQSVQNSTEAIKELGDRIASAEKELKEFAGSAEEEFRNTIASFERGFSAFIETTGASIKYLFNLITITYHQVAAAMMGLAGLGKKIADYMTPDAVEEMLGWNNEKRANEYFASMRGHLKDVKDDWKDMNDAADMFMKSIDMDYSSRKTPITDMLLGKSVADKQKEILTLQEKRTAEQKKLNDLNEKGEDILKDELGRSPRDIILASMTSQQQALIKGYRLQANLARREFEMAFDSPLDIKFAPIQSSISSFALGFQNDFRKFISTITKEFGLDEKGMPSDTIFDSIFDVNDAKSPFRAENFFAAAKKAGFIDSNGKINIDSAGIAKIFQLDDNFLQQIINNPAIKKEINKVAEMGGESLIPAQLELKLKELLEKYAATITQSVLSVTAQIRSKLVGEMFSETEGLMQSGEDLKNAKLANTFTKKRIGGLIRQNSELRSQAELERSIYLMRNAAANIDNESDDVKRVLALKDALADLNAELNTQNFLNDLNNEIVASKEKLAAMDIESKLISEGNTGLQLQKRIREEIRNLEIKALDQALKTGDINQEVYDTTKRMLELKDSLLDKEEQITEQIRIQQNLQKTREEIARDRLIDEAKSRGRDISEGMSFFERLKAGFGSMKDPGSKFAQRQEEKINIAFDIDIPTGAMIFDRETGGITIDPNKLRDLKGEAADSLLELYFAKVQQFDEEFKRAERDTGRASSFTDLLLGESAFRPREREYPLQRKNGGMIQGPSHAKGGVKGFLYGQPIELEGGEYVISKDAVAKYGMPLFESLNARKFEPGGPLDGVDIRVVMRQANRMAAQGFTKDAERLKKMIAEDYARRGVPTYGPEGLIAGDPSKMLKKEDRKKVISDQKEILDLREKEVAVLEKVNANNSTLAEETRKINTEFSFASEEIGYYGNSLNKEIATFSEMSEEQIKAIESTTSRRMTAEEEAAYSINRVKETYGKVAKDWREVSEEVLKKDFGYSKGAGFSYGDMGGVIAGPSAFVGSIYAEALGSDKKFEEFGKDVTSAFSDIESVFANGFAEPMTGLITVTAKRLLQNERFQQALERFMDMFYVLFDEFAEGLAIFIEAIVDMLQPLRPLMQMLGGFLKGIMRSLTQIIQPFAMLVESLQPILIYISGFLQIIVGIFSSIVGGIADIFKNLFTNVLGGVFGIDTQGYKSLNLLRQEKDILTEINSTIGDLSNSLGDIKDVIFEIMNSALNLASPSLKLELAAQKYNELYIAATSITATDEDIDEFQNFAKTYLQQAQDVLKSSVAYQQIYTRVIEDLEGIQNTLGADIGYEFTTKMKQAIFDLRLAGSTIADELVKATDAYQEGTLSFTDLATYVNFKLSQVEKDINLKDMADFGSLGDFTEVSQAYEDYLSDQFGRFEQAMGNAISNSSFEQDLAFLFGITPEGGVAAGATTKFVDIGGATYEIPVGITESEAFIATASGRSLSRQPELGDIQQAPDITQDRITGVEPPSLGDGIDLVKILEELLTGLWDALVKAIENIIGTFGEFLEAIFGWIADLGITAAAFLEELFTNLFEGTRTALEAIGDFFTEILNLDQLPDALGALGKFFESILNLDSLPDALGALGAFFDDIISGTGISDALSALGKFFEEIFGFESGLTATRVLEELFDTLFSGTRSAVDALGDFFGEILGTGSRSPLQALGDFFDEIIAGGSRTVSQALGDFFTKTISGTAQDVSSALGDFFTRIISGNALGISDFIDEFLGNLFSGSADAGVIIQGVFDQASSLLESIQLFKNPFHNAVGPEYLIEFASGGFLEGPSHKEGGIKAGVNGHGMVELEGGEFIINKKTVQSMGVPFFEFMNSLNSPSDLDVIGMPSFQEFLSPFKQSVNKNKDILRFDEGGFFGMDDLKKYSSSKFSFDTDDIFGSAKKMADVIDFKAKGFDSKTNNNTNAPSSKKDPMRWVEPANWIPQMRIFDISLGTKGWLKNLIGDERFEIAFNFPQGGVSAKVPGLGEFEDGGEIPKYVNGGVTDVGDFFIKTGGKRDPKTMSAYTEDNKLRETRLADNLKYSFEENSTFTDLDFGSLGLPDWISTPLTNIVKGTLGSGQDLAGWFFDAIGGFGGTIKDSLSVFDPFAFLKGDGSSIKEQLGVLETFIMGMALYFFTAAFAGPKSPIYPGFLGMNPGQLGLTGLLSLFLLTERPQKDIDKYNKYGGGVGTNSYADLIELFIEGAGGVPSKLKDVFVDGLGVDDSVGWLLLLATIMGGNYFGQRATGSSPNKAKGAFNPSTYIPAVPSYLKEDGGIIDGGLAIGPSHASGMLGLTKDGSPFIFEGGEYIMSREAVSNIGVSTLDQMNFGKGGAIANEMFDISGGSTKYGQFILIADYVDLGNMTAGVANNYFDHKYLDRMVTGSLKSDYESFGSGGSLRSFASGEAIGPSHQSGMLGMTPDGSPFLFEGGEYIINKKSAEKIGMDGLNALNSMGSGGAIREFGRSDYIEVDDYDIFSGFAELVKMDRAKAKREQPWYSKAWDGFKSGFGSAAKGLGYFANWLFPDMGKRTVLGSPGNAIATMLALSALPMIFTSTPDDPKTKEDEFEESPFNSILTGRLGKKDEFTILATLLSLGWLGYKGYGVATGQMSWFGNGGSLPEFAESNWVGDRGRSILRLNWLKEFNRIQTGKSKARSNAAFASNMAGIGGLALSAGFGIGSAAYLSEFLQGDSKYSMSSLSIDNLSPLGTLLASGLLGLGAYGMYNWADPFGGRNYGSGGGIPEFATSGEIARKKAFERGAFEISAGRDVSRSRAFRTDKGMNSSDSGMGLGGYLLALGILGGLYNNRNAFGSMGSSRGMKIGKMSDEEKLKYSLLAAMITGGIYYGRSTISANPLHSKPGDLTGALKKGSMFGLISLGLMSAMYGEGGGIPEFASSGLAGKSFEGVNQRSKPFKLIGNDFGAHSLMSGLYLSALGYLFYDASRRENKNKMNAGSLLGIIMMAGGLPIAMGHSPTSSSPFSRGVFGIGSLAMLYNALAPFGEKGALNPKNRKRATDGDKLLSLIGTALLLRSAYSFGSLAFKDDIGPAEQDSKFLASIDKASGSLAPLAFMLPMVAILSRTAGDYSADAPFGKYASGGVLQAGGLAKGPSHQSGMVGYAKGGMPFLFEGGEYILSKDATSSVGIEYLDMLNSMGSGGVIPSFETSGAIPENLKLYGRRDLFGMRTISTTADDGSTQEVTVMNYDDFAEAGLSGSSTNELLFGISEILFSIYDSQGLGMGSFIPTLEEATESEKATLRDLKLLVEDDDGVEKMLVPGGLLTRTQLDLISPFAQSQFTDAVATGVSIGMAGIGAPTMKRVFFNDEEIAKLSQEERQDYFQPAIMDPTRDVENFHEKFQMGGLGYYQETKMLPEGLDVASPSFIMGFSAMAIDQLRMAFIEGFALVTSAQIYEAEKAAEEAKSKRGGIEGSATPMENQMLVQMGLMGAFSGMGAGVGTIGAGGMGYMPSVLATAGVVAGRNTAEDGKQDQSTAGALLGGAVGSMAGPWGAAIGASLGAELAGKPNKYFKDFDGQALVEPFQGLVDTGQELEATGIMNTLSEGIPDVGMRLTEGFDNFGNYLSDTAFAGAGTGVRDFADDFQKWVESLWDGLFGTDGALSKILNFDWLTEVSKAITFIVKGFFDPSEGLFFKLPREFVNGGITRAVEGIPAAIENAFKLFFDIENGLFWMLPKVMVQGLTELVFGEDGIGKAVENIYNAIMEFFGSLLTKLSEGLTGSLEEIASFQGKIIGSIINFMFIDPINELLSKITGTTESGNVGIFPVPPPFKALGLDRDYFLEFDLSAIGISGAPQITRLPGLDDAESKATGGLAVGPSHENGGIPGIVAGYHPIEFEGGEYIINKKSVDLLGSEFFDLLNSTFTVEDARNVFNIGLPEPQPVETQSFAFGGILDKLLKSAGLDTGNPFKKAFGGFGGGTKAGMTSQSGGDSYMKSTVNKGAILDKTFSIGGFAGRVMKGVLGKNGIDVYLGFDKASATTGSYANGGSVVKFQNGGDSSYMKSTNNFSGTLDILKYGPKKISQGLADSLGLLRWWRNGGEVPKYLFGGLTGGALKVLSPFMPYVKAGLSAKLGSSPKLDGYVDWWWGNGGLLPSLSPVSSGLSYATGGMTSSASGSGFSSSLIINTGITNDLLRTLIQVTENKDMNVTVVDEDGNEKSDSRLMISQNREREYRGARMLA